MRRLLYSSIISYCYLATAYSAKPTASNKQHNVKGLMNLGNTCYMNSMLQAQFHIPAIRRLIINSQDTESIAALGDLYQTLEDKEENNRGKLYNMMRKFCSVLGINPLQQQDSAEFWKLLLPTFDNSLLQSYYTGKSRDYLRAKDDAAVCKEKDVKFTDLSMDLVFEKLELSLRHQFQEAELLSVAEGNGWKPQKGAEPVDAYKGSHLFAENLPNILSVQLKRFQYDFYTDNMSKINSKFEFPLVLDLTDICEDSKNKKISNDDDDGEKVLYELQSVIVHAGEFGSGHYYVYVRPSLLDNDDSCRWYRIDDDRVTKVNFDSVRVDAFGGDCSNLLVQSQKRRRRSKNKKRDTIVKETTSSSSSSRGFFLFRLFRRNNNRRVSPIDEQEINRFGYGGRQSSAYVLQYVRRSEIETLYATE